MTHNPYAPPNAPLEQAPKVSAAAHGRTRFWVRFYLVPIGRTGRLFYWVFGFIPLMLVGLGVGYLTGRTPDAWQYLLIASLLLLWPQVVILARRLHDLNISGLWVILLWAIPLVFSRLDTPLPPRTGTTLVWLAAIVIGCIPGTRGANKYGDDPSGKRPSAQNQ